MDPRQETAFWDSIDALERASVLPHVLIIGSWAEYLYTFHFDASYVPIIRTRDVDLLYPWIRRPAKPIDLERMMRDAGFVVVRDSHTQAVKLLKEDLLEIEFLTRQIGAGRDPVIDIPAIGMRGQALRDVNLLAEHPMVLEAKEHQILVPEPAVYVLQKILIHPHRVPAWKKEKDLESVRGLMPFIRNIPHDLSCWHEAVSGLSDKERSVLQRVAVEQFLDIPVLE